MAGQSPGDAQEPEFAGARIMLRVFFAVLAAAVVACGVAGYLAR